MIKTLSKVGLEGTYVNIRKAIYAKPAVSITLNGQKIQAFPLRLGMRQGYQPSPLIQHSTGSLSHSNQTGRRNKRHPKWKGRSKTDMILYIENPKDSTKKLLELINEFSNVAGYKFNIQKLVAFFVCQ